jgi:hypothetical protein
MGNADEAADAETIGMVMTKLYQSEVETSSRLIKPRHLRAEGAKSPFLPLMRQR